MTSPAEINPIRSPEPDQPLQGMAELRQNFTDSMKFSGRMLGITGSRLKQFVGDNKITIGVVAGGVALLGGVEARLLLNDWNLPFMATYAASKLIAAQVWLKDSPQFIAALTGQGGEILRNFPADVANGVLIQSQSDLIQGAADKLHQVSSIIAGGALFGVATKMIFTLGDARDELVRSIMGGKEKIWKTGEQLFFVGGTQSGVLEARMNRTKRHTLPILEDQKGAGKFIQSASKEGHIPTYLLIGDYATDRNWDNIQFDPGWLISVKSGADAASPDRKILAVVGDGSVYEEALDLGQEAQIDVTVKELQLATDKLVGKAKDAGINLNPDEDVVRIYLGNGRRIITSGGGGEKTLRQRVQDRHSAEVFIDTRSPLVERLHIWLGDRKEVVFDTTNQEYFDTIQKLLGERGIRVYDQDDPDIPPKTRRIVYENLTATTLKTAEEIVKHEGLAKEDVLAFTDTQEGHLSAEKEGITDICSALVYDAEIEYVMTLIKQGLKPQQIQEVLDARWDYPGLERPKKE